MGELARRVGEKAGPYEFIVDSARIEAFRAAVGAAPVPEAPPTFMTIFRDGEFALFQRFGVPLSSVLHAEQSYRYGEPILAGDQLIYETELVQALEKKGGQMTFLIFETRILATRAGQPFDAGSARSVIVVRGGTAS